MAISVANNSGLFLAAGGLFLIACVAFVYRLLVSVNNKIHYSGLGSFQLSLKNAGRKRVRSITTIALLALGVFTIMITGANQKTFYGAQSNRSSGTGGFSYWVETSSPIIYNLNTESGKEQFGLEGEDVLNDVEFAQFHVLSGDDASCLNLNQVSRPQIIGIDPNYFDERQSFSFTKLLTGIDREHPWLELNRAFPNGIIPAFADQTVITWGLMKKVGDTLTFLNENGNEVKVLLVGGLSNSIFQGNLLIADEYFRENFPSVSGSKIMLVDGGEAGKHQIKELLQSRLVDFGIEITSTAGRLAGFNSVTNTYLSVFMALGGLGVLIGTLGLGILLLRNMLERKQELALLKALGFRNNQIFRVIFIENLFLLISGIVVGVLSAIIGILPSMISPAFEMNTSFVAVILVVIFISGVVWIYLHVRSSLNKSLIESLRSE
jgi:ABC-type lipoprotein release transport system permease subunit